MKHQISILSRSMKAASALALTFLALVAMDHSSEALALDKRVLSALKDMEPSEQLIQRCELETLSKLDADRVVAYTFEPMEYTDNHLEAPGAAYRKGGDWFRLSYSCTTSEDRMEVVKFSFEKGDKIPEEDWGDYNLFR
ncbi:DUF930 domain-containing protein [uncultured Cohaesibacter sp.]|uniref:DUF930 domain-containing protein n=1 Tax=uncultured Cohaesibacter sp. TaxID=1002546 RepID=UPI0029C7BB3C|nr:DUF930 domain-containing protein [uncultured Cohaesibacter sp.]